MSDLETACRRILGQAKWQTTEALTPSQLMEAVAILREEVLAVEAVAQAVKTLQSWGWFREAGIIKPPWDVTEDDWARLVALAPWAPRAEQTEMEF